jgi:hypothetical protein
MRVRVRVGGFGEKGESGQGESLKGKAGKCSITIMAANERRY